MVNTEQEAHINLQPDNYNILNIVVNTELAIKNSEDKINYNILNIVVNTEREFCF